VITDGRTIPEIPPETFEATRSHINGSEGTDVTGGMLGKVRELLEIRLTDVICLSPPT
jgi:isopentenyl phosphate kinase